jgi:hypothetical protein
MKGEGEKGSNDIRTRSCGRWVGGGSASLQSIQMAGE